MRRILVLFVFLCFSFLSVSAQQNGDSLPTIGKSKKKINILRDENSEKEMLIYEGEGQDVISLDDYSINDYPFLYIEHPSIYGSFRIYGSNSDKNYILYNEHDTYSVIPMIHPGGVSFLKKLSYVEVSNITGKWKVALLPPSTVMVPEYKTPVIINGDQSSTLYMKNPGRIASIRFESNHHNTLKQIFPNGEYHLLINGSGDKTTKVKIENCESYFAIKSSGRWVLSFEDNSEKTPEVVFLDNEENFKLASAKLLDNENTQLDFPVEEEVDVQNGILGKWYECGDKYRFMIYYQPIMAKSQSYQTAKGMFILFRVKIANMSNEVIHGLADESFSLSRIYNNEEVFYPLSDGNSYETSLYWDIETLRDDIVPASEKDTYLVFDVYGTASDTWYLSFSPMEYKTNAKHCTIKMTLPKIAN